MSATKSIGDRGEAAAQRFLQSKGYRVVSTQWKCKEGEIDIVALQGELWVFVEVKTRRGGQSGDALAAITASKRQRLISAAYEYIARHGLDDPEWRVDAVAVTIKADGSEQIAHVEDALDW